MDLDHLLLVFFGTADLADLTPGQLTSGVDRLRLQLGLERDGGRRFALWCLTYTLGAAPDLDIAFKNETDRDAARTFMAMVDRTATAADKE